MFAIDRELTPVIDGDSVTARLWKMKRALVVDVSRHAEKPILLTHDEDNGKRSDALFFHEGTFP